MGDREVRAKAGKERTPAECRARARWERAQARKLRGTKYGHILAPGHIAAAEAYEQLALEREHERKRSRGIVVKSLKFGSRSTRFGNAKPIPDPKVYLSFSEGTYRVIHQGVPISVNKPTAREALQVAEHFKLKVSDRMWDGDNGRWVRR